MGGEEGIPGLGRSTDTVARVPGTQPGQLGLNADELLVLALVGPGEQIGEVLARCGLPEPAAVRALLELKAKGAIQVAGASAPLPRLPTPVPPVAPMTAPLRTPVPPVPPMSAQAAPVRSPTPAPLRTPVPPVTAQPPPVRSPTPAPLRTPVPPAPRAEVKTSAPPPRAQAAGEAVDLPEERQREILELERKLSHANLFDLLGVAAGADRLEVRNAYHQLSMKFHPDRYFNKELGTFRAKLELIFRKLTEAHTTLTDEGRRAAYLKEHPALARADSTTPSHEPTPEERARDAERRARLSKHPYLAKAARVNELIARSRGSMEKREYDKALADLNAAVTLDPLSKEAAQLLGEARRHHEARRVKEALKRAAELEAQLDNTAALAAYRAALNMDGSCAEAAVGAARLLVRSGGDLREARLMAQRAVDIAPKEGAGWAVLGAVYLALEQKKPAKENFQKALELDPSNAEAKKQLKKLKWVL